MNVEVIWKGPLKEDDLKSQVDLVQSFTAQGVSGIVLAPLNDTALGAPVKAAQGAQVPVVIFDSDLKEKSYVSFVATDNRAAGRLAGERMGKLLAARATYWCFAIKRALPARTIVNRGSCRRSPNFPK